jgi:galactokinase
MGASVSLPEFTPADPAVRQNPSETSFTAPARVNLIGEHTDYTGGLVLPAAIPFYTVATLTPTEDSTYSFVSDAFDTKRVLDMEDRNGPTHEWTDYPVGVLRQVQQLGIPLKPFRLTFEGDIPTGAGLSSSASIEVATALALLTHAGASLPVDELALLCQRAENEYVGSPCGIMDQFSVAAGEQGHALLLNTRDLSYELLPMNAGALADTHIVIANSTVRHSIAGGDYGLRRRELEAGQAVLRQQTPGLRDLGDATLDQLEAAKDAMSAESYRRCPHVITENARVREAGAAMTAGDPPALGKAMLASHTSQRDDFQCSCDEIDFLVATASTLPGCFGARLTGGGFGGCTVNLVAAEHVESFSKALTAAYQERFHLHLLTYDCVAVDGAVRANSKVTVGS